MKLYFSREVLSWSLYDFANSAFATSILSVIFNVYFVKVICAGGVHLFGAVIPGESFWGYLLSFSMLIVFLLAPILGAIADFAKLKKKFLLFFCILGCIFTGSLFFFVEGEYWLAGICFVLANIGFATGNVFYNALLQDISTPEKMGRISGAGWALGYIGGGLMLTINLLMIEKTEWLHISSLNHLPIRIVSLSVAIWWFVFSLPIFLFLKEKIECPHIQSDKNYPKGRECFASSPKGQPNTTYWRVASYLKLGIQNVVVTFHKVREYKELFKYLIAYMIYNDGIETIILMASVFGSKELGMTQRDLIFCYLMIQAVAFLGSVLFGYLADRIGHKLSISITLTIYTFVCLWATVIKTPLEFWILGAIIGMILGGSQAASRSLLAILSPPENSTQFFGFFALTGKLSTVIGPFVFALLTQLYSLRTAVSSLTLFFVLGLTILYFVREPQRTMSKV